MHNPCAHSTCHARCSPTVLARWRAWSSATPESQRTVRTNRSRSTLSRLRAASGSKSTEQAAPFANAPSWPMPCAISVMGRTSWSYGVWIGSVGACATWSISSEASAVVRLVSELERSDRYDERERSAGVSCLCGARRVRTRPHPRAHNCRAGGSPGAWSGRWPSPRDDARQGAVWPGASTTRVTQLSSRPRAS